MGTNSVQLSFLSIPHATTSQSSSITHPLTPHLKILILFILPILRNNILPPPHIPARLLPPCLPVSINLIDPIFLSSSVILIIFIHLPNRLNHKRSPCCRPIAIRKPFPCPTLQRLSCTLAVLRCQVLDERELGEVFVLARGSDRVDLFV